MNSKQAVAGAGEDLEAWDGEESKGCKFSAENEVLSAAGEAVNLNPTKAA